MKKPGLSFARHILLPFALLSAVADLHAQSDYATPYTFTTIAGLASGPGSTDATGTAARFDHPSNLVRDASGNVYVADTNNNTVRKITPAGVVTTLAGMSGAPGSTDGTGSAARFSAPTGVTADASGNIFVADTGNNTVRKITSGGIVTTFAGLAGNAGSVDGTGSAARFRSPFALTVDGSGNLYVADTYNHVIRKITSGGVVTTFAGTANSLGSADGSGNAARFNYPTGVVVNGSGNIYVADSYNHTIRRITVAGEVTTAAGTAGSAGSTDATGSAARFNTPLSLTTDAAGYVYVTDTNNHTIREITPAGDVSTLAGTAGAPGSVDATGSAARFHDPAGITVDGSGNVYVADTTNATIRKIASAGGVTTFAGTAVYASADGSGSAARFTFPLGAAMDSNGNIYVADSGNATIRKLTPAGTITTLAGLAGSPGSADGTGAAARFNNPSALAVDSLGNVYVADTNNNTVRKITAAGVVTTLAGTAGSAGSGDGNGSAARFNYPSGAAVDSTGNVYVADAGNATIRQITPSGAVTTPAGSAGSVGSADGTGGAARFNYPSGLAVDGSGNLYVAEVGNSTLRKITSAWQVTTLAGTAGNRGSADGTGSSARFNSPSGLAVDGAGNLYVADTDNHLIRKVTGAGVVTTLAGAAGINGVNDGTGSAVRFNLPHGVAVSGSGSVYVADTYNNTIRIGGPSPQVNALTFGTNNFAANAVAGAQVNFTYNVTNSGTKPWGVHHLLALRQFDYTKVQMSDLGITLPGTDKAVNFSFIAPSTPGTYQYRVQPLEDGIEWFGSEVFLTLTVGGVGPQTNALTYGTHNFPATATPGATVIFTYNVTNSGTKTWGANHLLALRQFDFTIIQMGALATSMPGGNKIVSYTFTAPSTPGTYQYRVQPLENGVEWFGAEVFLSLTVGNVGPPTNGLTYGSTTFPASASPGSTVNFTYNVTNSGTKTWGTDHLLAFRQFDYTPVQMGALSTTPAGGGKVVSYSFTAPSTPGTYQYRVQPLENGLEWFGSEVILTLTVGGGGPQVNGLTYGSTTFTGSASAGATVNFNYNVTNSGTKAWGANHLLAFRQFGYTPIQMGALGPTAAGGSNVVAYSFTAPSTPGTYQYRIQPLENGLEWFGSEMILTLNVGSGFAVQQSLAISAAPSHATLNAEVLPDSDNTVTLAADFNGDGLLDLLWQNTGTGECGIHLMQGDSVSYSVFLGTMPLEWHIVGTGDYDVDGQTDIFWQNTATGECSIWLMHGTSVDSVISLSVPQ